eukprot:gnl/TRDRNA2_/TRDRNA2_116857_c0_seq1.p1 gnl/TRDRNA2_/TRDRNA2_116857_c0~~gnl/TRDRNA2_/TRDRNA2_116857_c0_seq1.p1  ORF type:complete len:118 (+),score=10.59 gnl/TRDRNA2_/TRDRNA2_116857_c0_seq1:316-669(+)
MPSQGLAPYIADHILIVCQICEGTLSILLSLLAALVLDALVQDLDYRRGSAPTYSGITSWLQLFDARFLSASAAFVLASSLPSRRTLTRFWMASSSRAASWLRLVDARLARMSAASA